MPDQGSSEYYSSCQLNSASSPSFSPKLTSSTPSFGRPWLHWQAAPVFHHRPRSVIHTHHSHHSSCYGLRLAQQSMLAEATHFFSTESTTHREGVALSVQQLHDPQACRSQAGRIRWQAATFPICPIAAALISNIIKSTSEAADGAPIFPREVSLDLVLITFFQAFQRPAQPACLWIWRPLPLVCWSTLTNAPVFFLLQ